MTTHPNVKINIGLHVVQKREDGYHDIETLFVPCPDLSDTLEIEPARETSVLIDYPSGQYWTPEQDLVFKAYRLLKADFDLPPVRIRLVKTSPVGAGLGGGSADAAFALRMLSELFGLGLPAASLAGYAASLGSDCPFFVYNTPMIGRGRGEILTPFNLDEVLGPDYEIRITVPEGIHVSTADAYRGITPRCSPQYISPQGSGGGPLLLEDILHLPVEQWKHFLFNDFETTVFARYPALAEAKAELYSRGAVYASMSGSGSALFGIFCKNLHNS